MVLVYHFSDFFSNLPHNHRLHDIPANTKCLCFYVRFHLSGRKLSLIAVAEKPMQYHSVDIDSKSMKLILL